MKYKNCLAGLVLARQLVFIHLCTLESLVVGGGGLINRRNQGTISRFNQIALLIGLIFAFEELRLVLTALLDPLAGVL